MRYFISDIHGEYDLFLKLLDKIGFSDGDTMYILGDMTDKGEQSVRLVDFVRQTPNMTAILGNHEFAFVKYYHGLMRSFQSGDDADAVLDKLREYFPRRDGEKLSWDTVDYIESLPYYIESDGYVCVHAGVETDERGIILPMNKQLPEVMVYSRDFKEKYYELSPFNKTVLFGHTPCSYENGTGRFIKTVKTGILNPGVLTDYSKIRLDCGVYLTNVLGTLRMEDMREFYVEKT